MHYLEVNKIQPFNLLVHGS